MIVCKFLVGVFRTRYYQEAQEDIYSGPLFLICYFLFSLPFSLATVAAGSRIIFQWVFWNLAFYFRAGKFAKSYNLFFFFLSRITGMSSATEWTIFGAVLWGCYLVGEYQTIAILMVVRSYFTAVLTSSYITTIYFILASGILR
jgi:hypothetical protein